MQRCQLEMHGQQQTYHLSRVSNLYLAQPAFVHMLVIDEDAGETQQRTVALG